MASAWAALRALGTEVDWDEHRHVAGKAALAALEDASVGPLRDALASHVAWLTVARVAQPSARRLEVALLREIAVVRLDREQRASARGLVAGLLAARTSREASAWFAAFPQIAPAVAEPARTLREVRAEAFRRLGIDDVAARFLGAASDDLERAAVTFLETTADLARDVTRPHEDAWPLALDVRLARGAKDGWPARLGWRAAAALLPGLTVHVTALGEPPRSLGAASFARALEALGAATQRCPPGASGPFALREAPLSAAPARTGLAFASALGERAFHARVLGLGSGRAGDQARTLAAAALLDARFAALRVAARGGDFEALSALALGAPLPRSLDEAWPLRRDEDLARWLGWLAAPPLVGRLREREGDDWFRNPRAFETLRDLGCAPASLDEDAAARLARRLEEALG